MSSKTNAILSFFASKPLYKLVGTMVVLVTSLIFIMFPKIDLEFSNLFYDRNLGFYLSQNYVFKFLYNAVPFCTKLLSAICVIGVLYQLTAKRDTKAFSSPLMYLLLAAILGPGLLVNTVLKDGFGRARPSQIVEFGGTKEFTPPFTLSDQCERNCSFTSGHAAMAFYFTALAYIAPYPLNIYIYYIGLLFGSLVGTARIAQGGHYLSDVFFSALFVLIINHYLHKLFKRLSK